MLVQPQSSVPENIQKGDVQMKDFIKTYYPDFLFIAACIIVILWIGV